MSRRRSAGTFPEPPWSYAPSEVADWLASTAGPGSRRASRSRRRLHVKGFVGHCPTSAEGKLLRRLAEFGFAEAAGAHRFPPFFRWMAKSADAVSFVGNLGETQVHIRLHAVVEHEDFAMAIGIKRARIDVVVALHLNGRDFEAFILQQFRERR